MAKRIDVANEAGVSTATVSHVLNQTKYVSEELRERVLNAAKKLDYYPNSIAQSMVTKKSKHFAMLVNDLKNPRYSEIAETMQNEAAKYGYIVSILSIDSFGLERERMVQIISRNIDGIFVATYVDEWTESLQLAKKSGIPIISATEGQGVVLNTDYSKAIEELTKDLISLGHRKIGYLSGYSIGESQHRKFNLFKRELEKNGVYQERYVEDFNPDSAVTIRTGYEEMKRLYARAPEVTAVFCANDLAAIGALRYLHEIGVRVPADMSIIGCDDIEMAQYCMPSLSTIEVPKREMGKKAVEMLIKLCKGEKADDVWVPTNYVKRESTYLCRTKND